ncbi:MAG: hypothetical protein JNG90_07445 [Planctomycetaceae bacterium]|nr:hypothetical protein [Planctomycetaceae bacterium]
MMREDSNPDSILFEPDQRALRWLQECVGLFFHYVEEVAGESRVTEIDLSETTITDEALTHVGQLTGLECLSLDDTNVSDVGLRQLFSLVRLKRLELRNTRASDAGINSLQQQLPACEMIR